MGSEMCIRDRTTNTQGEEGSKGSNDAPRSGWDWHAGWRAPGLRRDTVLSQCPAIKRGESSEAARKPESQGGPNGPRGFRGVSSSGDDAPGHASFLLPPAPPPTTPTPPLPPLHLPFPESIFSPSHLQKNACEIGWVRLDFILSWPIKRSPAHLTCKKNACEIGWTPSKPSI